MSAVKHASDKIGEGSKHAVEGVGHAIEGLGKTVAGVLTANPKEIKAGLGDIGIGREAGATLHRMRPDGGRRVARID